MATRIQLRRDDGSAWFADNPVLAEGEPGYDRDLRVLKLGDGVTPWFDLPSMTLPGTAADGQMVEFDALTGNWEPIDPNLRGARVVDRQTRTDGVVVNWTSAAAGVTHDVGPTVFVPAQAGKLYLAAGICLKSNAVPGAGAALSMVATEIPSGIDAPKDVTLRATPAPVNGMTVTSDSEWGRGYVGDVLHDRQWKLTGISVGNINMDALNSATWPTWMLAHMIG